MNRLIPWGSNEANRNGNGDSQIASISGMRTDWDRLFDRILDGAWSPTTGTSHAVRLDVSETDEVVRIRAEVPGIEPEELDISLVGEVLTLSGEKLDESKAQAGRSYYSERLFGAFQRAVKLPCPVDVENIEAEHRNGVVTVTLRKLDTVRPKRIQIKSS